MVFNIIWFLHLLLNHLNIATLQPTSTILFQQALGHSFAVYLSTGYPRVISLVFVLSFWTIPLATYAFSSQWVSLRPSVMVLWDIPRQCVLRIMLYYFFAAFSSVIVAPTVSDLNQQASGHGAADSPSAGLFQDQFRYLFRFDRRVNL